MKRKRTKRFSQSVRIVGVNPYVGVPAVVVRWLLRTANRVGGPVPVKGNLNGKKFTQTVVKFRGVWRLYLNTPMRRHAGIDVGDRAVVDVQYDPKPRDVPVPPKFAVALSQNKAAKRAFEQLAPSRRKEILRYLGWLKSDKALERNIQKVISTLNNDMSRGSSGWLRVKQRP
ncbi:MAG TPA: YdeI/OmpD-associated family protein [Bacteroidota bacterium]